MKTIPKKQLFFLLSLLNLFVAYQLVAAADVNGTITINPCSANCLVLTAPTGLTVNTPIFLSPNGGNIFMNFNYDLNQKLEVTDRRYSGSFRVDLEISNLLETGNNRGTISSSQIGVLSFNNSATNSLDGTPADNTVISLIDPVQKGITAEPFGQNEFSALKEAPPTNYENYFTFLDGVSRVNGSYPTIINAPTNSGRVGTYSMGLGFLIKTPSSPHNTSTNARALRDGQYQTTLTFSLLSNAI